jgi:hypothetical protein
VGVGVGVAVFTTAVGVGVGVAVFTTAVGVGVGVFSTAVGVGVGVAVGVGVGVAVGIGVGLLFKGITKVLPISQSCPLPFSLPSLTFVVTNFTEFVLSGTST